MNQSIVSSALDIGEEMLASGGEVGRVEDTIRRILQSYGFVSVDVFTITSQIQVNAVDAQGRVEHQMRRIYQWGTDLEKLERLNQLSRNICSETPSPEHLRDMLTLEHTKETGEDRAQAYIGAILAASGFCMFFGGGLPDALATAVLACTVTWLNRRALANSENKLLFYFFVSAVTGFIGSLLVLMVRKAGITLKLDKMLIGCIMLTIPGISITYAVRDMLLGETITGLLRFIESLLIAASIACGFIMASMIMGG